MFDMASAPEATSNTLEPLERRDFPINNKIILDQHWAKVETKKNEKQSNRD